MGPVSTVVQYDFTSIKYMCSDPLQTRSHSMYDEALVYFVFL